MFLFFWIFHVVWYGRYL